MLITVAAALATAPWIAATFRSITQGGYSMRGHLNLAHVDRAELWRLAFRFMAEIDAAAVLGDNPEALRRPLRRLKDVLAEIRLRGEQLTLPGS